MGIPSGGMMQQGMPGGKQQVELQTMGGVVQRGGTVVDMQQASPQQNSHYQQIL